MKPSRALNSKSCKKPLVQTVQRVDIQTNFIPTIFKGRHKTPHLTLQKRWHEKSLLSPLGESKLAHKILHILKRSKSTATGRRVWTEVTIASSKSLNASREQIHSYCLKSFISIGLFVLL